MTDSFSSAYDSARNFFRRRWPWVVGALALTLAISVFLCRDWLAMYLGYEKTDLSPGARFLRDLFIGIAAILGIAMAGWRNFALDRQSKAAQEQAKIGNQQAQHDRDRIADERFSDAVKLLAQKDAENKPAIDARIGGIYSLQTLAKNRIKEYGAQVVKMLIAYIKQNAQLTAQPPLKENETPKEARALGEDVKTAFNVLQQLLAAREQDSTEWDKPPYGIKLSDQDLSFSGQDFSRLDLSSGQVFGLHHYIWNHANLQGAKLLWAYLQGAKLWVANLQGANLWGANLRGANLTRAHLQKTNLSRAYLEGADLEWAHLQDASLSEAHLQGADLSRTNLQGADLSDAQLQGAKLSGVELQGVDLSRTNLQCVGLLGAKLDDATELPPDLSGKIWHFGQSELSNIASRSPDAEWDLTPFLHPSYALVGVLQNYALRYGRRFIGSTGEDLMRARKLRLAARKSLDEKKLPQDFPQDWRDWLGEIESDGSHPNDPKLLD